VKKILLTTLLLALVLIPFQTQAICEGPLVPCGLSEDSPNTPGINERDPCRLCHLFALLDNILRFIITCLVPIVSVLMFTIGGVLFILSQFDIVSVDIFSKAKGTVTAVVIGLVIIFASWVFLNLFLSTIGVAHWTGLGSWWEITCRPPTYCEQCSDCPSGEYCEQARGICVALPACAECDAGYGFNPQEYNEDQRGDCSDCSTCSGSAVGPGSCYPVTDNTQHGDCDDLCEACQLGVCGDALAGTDPGNYCYPDPEYRNGGDTYYCQKREKDGNCNSSGACNTTYGAWYNIHEGLACSGNYECIGDTYYSPTTCSSGTCSGTPVDMGCCAGSYCPSGKYCDTNHLCTDLAVCKVRNNSGFGYSDMTDGTSCGTCKACVSGGCADQTTDWGGGDVYGCSGNNKKCDSGVCIERECSQGSECPSGEYCDSNYQCVSLGACRKAISNGLGDTQAEDTAWADNKYKCNGFDQRCYGGTCTTCQGLIYNDGCGGCSNQALIPGYTGSSNLACWYAGNQTGNSSAYNCNEVCSQEAHVDAYCVQANWNDTNNCTVTKSLVSCSCSPIHSFLPGAPWTWHNWWTRLWGLPPNCERRRSDVSQRCTDVGFTYGRRICVCDR